MTPGSRRNSRPRAVQSGIDWLDAHGHNAVAKDVKYFDPTAGNYVIWNQLIGQPDQMRQRCAFALSQFTVVSLNPIDGFWTGHQNPVHRLYHASEL